MSLEENLAALSLDELADAAYRLGLRLPGRTGRAKYTSAIIDSLASPEPLADALGYSRAQTLMHFLSTQRRRTVRFGRHPQLDQACAALTDFGLATCDEQSWHILAEARVLCSLKPEQENALREREALITTAEGWLRLYGMLPLEELEERMQTGQPEELLRVWGCVFGMRGFYSFQHQTWLLHPIVEMPEGLLMAVTADGMRDIPFAPFADADRQSAAVTGLPQRGRALEFCRSLYTEELISSGLMLMVSVMLQKRGLRDAAELLMALPKTGARIPSIEQALVRSCLEHFPQWQYKGYSAAEMTAMRRRLNPLSPPGRPLN